MKSKSMNTKLSPKDFERKVIYTDKSQNYVKDIKKIVFNRLTRPLKNGEFLTHSHLSPLSLVKAGNVAKVILKGNQLKLESKAMPMRSGRVGDLIQLRNIKSSIDQSPPKSHIPKPKIFRTIPFNKQH